MVLVKGGGFDACSQRELKYLRVREYLKNIYNNSNFVNILYIIILIVNGGF